MLAKDFCPKVSIVIPVYNGANYLNHAIDCALSQSYRNIEVIVVNDGSKDGGETEKIALSYGDKIRYFSKENGGVSSALNYGISQMSGEYFSWLSHDDGYGPDKISSQIEILRRTPGADERTVAYTWGHYMDRDGEFLKPFPRFLETEKLYSGIAVVGRILHHRILNGCCMLIPKIVFQEVGTFHEGLRYSQDALMWYLLFLHEYSLVFDGKDNVTMRIHDGQVTRSRNDLFAHDALVIADILAPHLAKHSSKHENLLYLYARKLSLHQCSVVVRHMRSMAVRSVPFTLRQNIDLECRLAYSKIRVLLKRIYYFALLRRKKK